MNTPILQNIFQGRLSNRNKDSPTKYQIQKSKVSVFNTFFIFLYF